MAVPNSTEGFPLANHPDCHPRPADNSHGGRQLLDVSTGQLAFYLQQVKPSIH